MPPKTTFPPGCTLLRTAIRAGCTRLKRDFVLGVLGGDGLEQELLAFGAAARFHNRLRLLRPRLEEPQGVRNHDDLVALLAVTGGPGVHPEVPLDEDLLALGQVLLDKIGGLAVLALVERLDVQEAGLV